MQTTFDQHLLEEDLELHLGEAGRNWERPAPPPIDTSVQSLVSATAHACPALNDRNIVHSMHHVCKKLSCVYRATLP